MDERGRRMRGNRGGGGGGASRPSAQPSSPPSPPPGRALKSRRRHTHTHTASPPPRSPLSLTWLSVEHFRQPGSGSTIAYPTGCAPAGGRPRGGRILMPGALGGWSVLCVCVCVCVCQHGARARRVQPAGRARGPGRAKWPLPLSPPPKRFSLVSPLSLSLSPRPPSILSSPLTGNRLGEDAVAGALGQAGAGGRGRDGGHCVEGKRGGGVFWCLLRIRGRVQGGLASELGGCNTSKCVLKDTARPILG